MTLTRRDLIASGLALTTAGMFMSALALTDKPVENAGGWPWCRCCNKPMRIRDYGLQRIASPVEWDDNDEPTLFEEREVYVDRIACGNAEAWVQHDPDVANAAPDMRAFRTAALRPYIAAVERAHDDPDWEASP